EQFYMIWPWVISFVSERAVARVAVGMIIGAWIVRWALRLVFPPVIAADAAYHFTIARCDAIAFGALVAVVSRDARASARRSARATSALAVGVLALVGQVIIAHGIPHAGRATELVAQTATALVSALVIFLIVADHPNETGAARLQRVLRPAMSKWWL